MWVLWAVWFIGWVASWIANYERVGFRDLKAEHDVDWREFLLSNLPWFVLLVVKVWFWPLFFVHWLATGRRSSGWRAVVNVDGRPVRQIKRVAVPG